jgi:hypothetical protein
MQAYLAQDYDWPGVQLSGQIRRSRRSLTSSTWEEQQTFTWVSSLSGQRASARLVSDCLRQHWTIENGVFWVRDVSYAEDRLHGRKIGPCLSIFRNVAINLIRRQGYVLIPDGWREIANLPDRGLHLLL